MKSRTIAAVDALRASDYRDATAQLQDAFLLGFNGRRARFSTHDEESAWECGMECGMKPAVGMEKAT